MINVRVETIFWTSHHMLRNDHNFIYLVLVQVLKDLSVNIGAETPLFTFGSRIVPLTTQQFCVFSTNSSKDNEVILNMDPSPE